jgi:glycerol-3-phosphate dehydrogenase
VPEHRMLSRRKFKQLFRAIEGDGLNGGAQYYDAQASLAERLCWENLRAAIDAGGVALNYTQVTELHRDGDRITGVSCRDELDGQTFEVYGHEKTIVINTAGPWVDRVCATAEMNGKPAPIGTRKMGGTKGSHIVVSPFPGAPDSALYVEAKSDGRPFFIVPWLGQYLIGTTDLPFEGSLDRIKADNDEIDYLLNETNSIVPGAGLNRDRVLFTYSGVRPLPYAEGKNTGSITRRHILFDHTSEGVANAISLIGGKLTTHRAVGEEMVDQIFKKRGDRVPACPTITTPLPGAILPDDPRIPVAVTQYRDRLSAETINYLFSIYGALALEVLALVDRDPSLASPLSGDRPDIQAQIVYAVESEAAKTIIDILRRRIPLSMLGGYGLDLLPVVASVLKTVCGWSADRCDRAIAEYETFMRENCIPDYALTRELATTSPR